jgi:hypothetical protein
MVLAWGWFFVYEKLRSMNEGKSKSTRGRFSQNTTEEMVQQIHQPCAQVGEAKKSCVVFPGYQMVNTVIE